MEVASLQQIPLYKNNCIREVYRCSCWVGREIDTWWFLLCHIPRIFFHGLVTTSWKTNRKEPAGIEWEHSNGQDGCNELLWHLFQLSKGYFLLRFVWFKGSVKARDTWWVDIFVVSFRRHYQRTKSMMWEGPASQAAILWGVYPWIVGLWGYE